MEHLHAVSVGVITEAIKYPLAKAGQISCNGRNAKGSTLERSVTPWFIVGWEYSCIKARQQVIVSHVEDAIVTVQVARHVNDGHFFLRLVVETQSIDTVIDGITVLVVEVMCDDRVEQAMRTVGMEVLNQVNTRRLHPGGHKH